MRFAFALMSISFATLAAHSAELLELRGKYYACKDAQTMNLWDISVGSPLIRYEMAQKEWCWKSPGGLRANKIGKVGRFMHMQHLNNGMSFFIYANDVGPISPSLPEKTVPPKTLIQKSVRLLSVKNTSEFGVELKNGKPTVYIYLDAGDGLLVDFGIVKEKVGTGFEQRITSQSNPYLSFGGKCKKTTLSLSKDWHFKIKITEVNIEKRFADLEVSGAWPTCSSDDNLSFELLPSKVRISGKQFDQLIRTHTPKELLKTIG